MSETKTFSETLALALQLAAVSTESAKLASEQATKVAIEAAVAPLKAAGEAAVKALTAAGEANLMAAVPKSAVVALKGGRINTGAVLSVKGSGCHAGRINAIVQFQSQFQTPPVTYTEKVKLSCIIDSASPAALAAAQAYRAEKNLADGIDAASAVATMAQAENYAIAKFNAYNAELARVAKAKATQAAIDALVAATPAAS